MATPSAPQGRLSTAAPVVHPDLRPNENHSVEQGAWFAALSPELRQAILARARVRHVSRGTLLVRRGNHASDWVGVASGALRLGTDLCDGRSFTLDLLGPGDWYGDIELMDGGLCSLEIRAHVNSTLLLVCKHDLHALIQGQPELHQALLQLDCRRLRHMLRRMEELQTAPLAQRVAMQLQRLLRQFGRPCTIGTRIDVALPQSDLASLLCASRQRINGVLRAMQAQGVVTTTHARITVLDPLRLDALAQGAALVPGAAGEAEAD
ncbi:MAG: Crp/Fnr family transcriptional regulator [Burkholderiales bacterium]|nr:Crp/Fnr family transcriptional regulator [Burkholderiales bacterium]